MIYLDFCKNKKVGVIGRGVTGNAVIAALVYSGAEVISFDDADKNNCIDVANNINCTKNNSININNQSNIDKSNYIDVANKYIDYNVWKNLDFIVTSPGIPMLWPQMHKIIQFAYSNFIPIYNDIDLFMKWALDAKKKVIAVTGTNGKSTTTALIHHLLEQNGISSYFGGNFGIPVLTFQDDKDVYVIELSSYQLESSKILNLDVAVLLNVTPDHLQRHANMHGYASAKCRIFAQSKKAVVCVDDEYSMAIFQYLQDGKNGRFFEKVVGTSSVKKLDFKNCVYVDDDKLYEINNYEKKVVFGLSDLQIHKQNVICAYAAVAGFVAFSDFGKCLKIEKDKCGKDNLGKNGYWKDGRNGCAENANDKIKKDFQTFKNLKHRQEFVKKVNNVVFINDSKATNAAAVQTAFDNYENFYWILGGIAKEGGIQLLIPHFSKVKEAFLIGQSAGEFKAVLDSCGVKCCLCKDLECAVNAAYESSLNDNNDACDKNFCGCEDVKVKLTCENVENEVVKYVLFSPACASFDQFNSYEHRGECFRQIVEKLK